MLCVTGHGRVRLYAMSGVYANTVARFGKYVPCYSFARFDVLLDVVTICLFRANESETKILQGRVRTSSF